VGSGGAYFFFVWFLECISTFFEVLQSLDSEWMVRVPVFFGVNDFLEEEFVVTFDFIVLFSWVIQ
jgi:hypothetical protein